MNSRLLFTLWLYSRCSHPDIRPQCKTGSEPAPYFRLGESSGLCMAAVSSRG